MLALGGSALRAGNHQTALSFYGDVMRIVTPYGGFDPMTFYSASRMTAVIRGVEGDHRGAVADLEKMFPLARMASSQQPYAYYDYLNALAVELGEVGQLERARRVSEITLASPFARAYPEWRETFDDIASKQRRASRSVVAVRKQVQAAQNLARMPAPEQVASRALGRDPEGIQARVLNFQQWKTMLEPSSTPVPNRLTPEQRRRMSTAEKLIRLMDLISQDETDEETIDRILEAVEGIVLGNRNKRLD
jgi:hypothetical protein